MIRQDYFKRQIDQLGKVLAKALSDLLGLRSQGNSHQGIEITDLALKSELGLGIEDLIAINDPDLVETLQNKFGFHSEHLESLANILLEVGENSANVSIQQSKLFQKSLLLFEFVEKKDTTFSLVRRRKIDRIKSYL